MASIIQKGYDLITETLRPVAAATNPTAPRTTSPGVLTQTAGWDNLEPVQVSWDGVDDDDWLIYTVVLIGFGDYRDALGMFVQAWDLIVGEELLTPQPKSVATSVPGPSPASASIAKPQIEFKVTYGEILTRETELAQ